MDVDVLDRGRAALAAGRWADARDAFDAALTDGGPAEAWWGLAGARWWLGDDAGSVEACTEAYAGFRRGGDVDGAVQCAVWLAITYKANFGNFPAAEGWLGRADRLLATVADDRPPGPAHAWVAIARAYRLDDLATAAALTTQALDLARDAGDVDLELVALAQLGRIRVAGGDTAAGFALLDEAMAGALAGEPTSLDTVVYTCCDMLNACDLATDLARAAQWCTVADTFVERYGCPFLYAECRTLYGGVLVANGRWEDAETELATALRHTGVTCPGLHTRALVRLADLRLRQGRLEDAEQLLADLDTHVEAEAEAALTRAALRLARGDADGAGRALAERLERLSTHRLHAASALATLVDAHLALGDLPAATTAATHLTSLATTPNEISAVSVAERRKLPRFRGAGAPEPPASARDGDGGGDRLVASAASARGRVALAGGEHDTAVGELERALGMWTTLALPYEAAGAMLDLARALAPTHPELAADHARRALGVFERLGAARQADRADAQLRELGVRARTGPRNVGLLTQREQEVLGLLGQGLTNPEIGRRLHMSRKTAAHHVSRILAKLGARNRAEAAAVAAAAARQTPQAPTSQNPQNPNG